VPVTAAAATVAGGARTATVALRPPGWAERARPTPSPPQRYWSRGARATPRPPPLPPPHKSSALHDRDQPPWWRVRMRGARRTPVFFLYFFSLALATVDTTYLRCRGKPTRERKHPCNVV